VACVRREVSNTPLQSLTLLNNEVHHEAALGLASRVMLHQADDRGRLELAWRICLGRIPEAEELAALQAMLDAARTVYQDQPELAGEFTPRHRPENVPPPEFAAWAATMRVVLNLDEFLTRE
jgi:hypothetical protein